MSAGDNVYNCTTGNIEVFVAYLLHIMFAFLIPNIVAVVSAAPLPNLPSAMGNLSTTSATIPNVGGFKAGPEPRNQDVYLFYPTDGSGNYPLVAFAHGCCKTSIDSSHTDYIAVFTHLASNGIVVAAFNTCLDKCPIGTYSADQVHLVEAISRNISLHPILGAVDFSRVVLMGHSMGGGATVDSSAASPTGVTIRAAVAIDPAPGLRAGDIKVPTFFGCGQNDTIVPCWSVQLMFEAAPSSSGRHVYSVLRNAGHCDIQVLVHV